MRKLFMVSAMMMTLSTAFAGTDNFDNAAGGLSTI